MIIQLLHDRIISLKCFFCCEIQESYYWYSRISMTRKVILDKAEQLRDICRELNFLLDFDDVVAV